MRLRPIILEAHLEVSFGREIEKYLHSNSEGYKIYPARSMIIQVLLTVRCTIERFNL
jgi:hypothetical protein